MRYRRPASNRALYFAACLACSAPTLGLGACGSGSDTPDPDAPPLEAGAAPVMPQDAALDARGPLVTP
ncbi:MAG TPA: hypothetical protein VFZ61_29940, partial [Polyangiales bacterium]